MPTAEPPVQIRHLIFGAAPHAAAAPAPHMSTPKVNSGLLQRGESAAHSSEGGGGHRSAGGGNSIADAGFNDPVVTGMDYEQNPQQHGILGLLNNGKQSAAGAQQEALHGRFQQMSTLYNQVLDQGGTQQQAMTAVHRADPKFLMDVLVTHPGALKAFQTASDLHDFIAGKTPAETPGEITKGGQQIFRDANGNARAQDVPGFDKPVPKPEKLQTVQTANGPMILNPDKTTSPILGPDGKQVEGKPTAANTPPGTVPSDIPGIGPQLSPNNKTKGGEDRISTNFLGAVPGAIEAMQDIYSKAQSMGVLKGFITTKSGEFLGINGKGGAIQADLDVIRAAAPQLGEAGYKATVDNLMGAMANPSQAPSFLRQQLPQMIDMFRDRAQQTAENVTQTRNAPLPPPVANRLIDVGIVPNGYQNQATMDRMNAKDPGSAARWKLQFAQPALTSADKSQIYNDMANGKYGPLPQSQDAKGNPIPPDQWAVSPDFKRGYGIGQQTVAAQQARQQQAASSAAAAAAQPRQGSAVPSSGTPAVPQAPGEEVGTPAARVGMSGNGPDAHQINLDTGKAIDPETGRDLPEQGASAPSSPPAPPAAAPPAAPANDAENSNQAVSGAGAGRSPATQTPPPAPAPAAAPEPPKPAPESPYTPDPMLGM